MKSKVKISLFLVLLFHFASCKKDQEKNVDLPTDPTTTLITFVEDNTNFPNPERGFYGQSLSGSAAPSQLNKAYFDKLKSQNVTMIRRLYSMTTFRDKPISSDFLDHIQKDMDLIRENGFKIILRFAYTFNEPAPWNDAPENIILPHIDQLKPLLQKNADVIAMMEAGFIGRWGEWHTSSNKLDNAKNQRNVLLKLLDALPKSRFVLVRTQQQKKDIFEKNDPISESEAFNESNRSRTGHHNDCFLASDDDWGTYWPNDAASLNAQKKYLNQENKYVPQEGETCNCNPPRSDCALALKDLEQMRWSTLNQDYIACVLNSWKTSNCYEEIAKRLGYRFKLINAEIPKSLSLVAKLKLKLIVKNEGFASPYNARNIELILRSKTSGFVYKIKLQEDVRKWLPDLKEITLILNLDLPQTIEIGEYDVLLNLSDPEKSLNTNAAYSIRFANEKVWEPSTGYNSLLSSIKISK